VKVQYYDSKVDELNELIKNSENAIKELELELQNRRK
jgi:hypothetical protein